MSASSDEEDYQSAEEREAGGNDTNTSQLSKDLEGARLSEKDDSMREPETRHFCSDNSSGDMRGATQPDNRTTESSLNEGLPPDSRDQPVSDNLSSNSQKVVELTEEEITVGMSILTLI